MGGESEKIVDELDASFQSLGLTVTRDKKSLAFKGLITDFMKKIGAGKAVVVVISDKYLKSPYCMFELMEIYGNRNFVERIFPIVLDDASVFDPILRLGYLKYWHQKKTELGLAIENFGADAITVAGEEYKIYHKIFNNFGEVVNVLKDINALSPQLHRASAFQELYHALTHRLNEDSKYTQNKSVQNLSKHLYTSSLNYHKELTGINGPYYQLNILEAILGGIKQDDIINETTKIRLQTTVKSKDIGELKLESHLDELWLLSSPHVILLGDGGMGKTVSLIHLWETLLKNSGQQVIPLFLTLHEYNSVSEHERHYFISKRILWHYLGLKDNLEVIDALWELYKTTPQKGMPRIVLLLDGFNEVTVESGEKRHLLLELQELRQKGKAVQIVLSSRYELNFTWAEGFQSLEIQPLNEKKIRAYLQTQRIGYPEEQRLQEILQNPMMLTLHANTNEIIEKYKQNKEFDFKPSTRNQGELLWNFLEAQIVKLSKICGSETADFYYYKFLIHHFLPYVGFEMEQTRQFVFDENQLAEIVNEACRYFYRKQFVQIFLEYRLYLKGFNLKELDFVEEAERFVQITKAFKDLGLIKNRVGYYEFLHQNFRDYFATVHLLNEMQIEAQSQQIPSILTSRTIPVYIRKFAGQIVGEQHQIKSASAHQRVLVQTLDNLREIFDEARIGYAVWNIVNILKDTRNNLRGVNLSGLNLMKTGLQNTFLYERYSSFYDTAKFDNSLLGEKNFLPQGHSNFVESLAFHPNGKTFISASCDETIKQWDLNTGECLATFHGHSSSVKSVAFHPDGKTFISASYDQTIKVWNLDTRECLNTFEEDKFLSSLAFNPDGKTFISAFSNGTIKVWNLGTGQCLTSFDYNISLNIVAFHPNRKTFISASSLGQTIKAWDLHTGKCLSTFEENHDLTTLAFHPDGKIFISASYDRTTKAWDLDTGECLATFYGHSDRVRGIAFHPDGKTFISASDDTTIKSWDLKTGRCLATFRGHKDSLTSVVFHPDGEVFISSAGDNTVKAWDLQTGECIATFQGYSWFNRCIAFHPDGKIFISASSDHAIKVWDPKTAKCLDTFRGHSGPVDGVAFHPSGETFISSSHDNTIKAWDLKTGECIGTFRGDNDRFEKIAFNPSGEVFISSSHNTTIKAWDMKTRKCLATFRGHNAHVNSVAFHPNGNTFISASSDQSIKVWDLKAGECLATFQGHTSYATNVVIHPDGNTFISAMESGTIKEIDLKTGKWLATFRRHGSSVTSVIFHPNGNTFISASEDKTIKAWNLKTRECLTTFEGHNSPISSIAFHPDGKSFISASDDDIVKLWDLKTGKCLTTMKNLPGLFLAGCSFMAFHPESQFTQEGLSIMRQHGAIFDENDKLQWDNTVKRVFGNE